MVLASLATQGMAQGLSPQQHLTNVSADFHAMNMPDKELEALILGNHTLNGKASSSV